MLDALRRRVSRRRVLGGLGGAALLATGGLWTWQCTGYSVPEPTRRRLRSLSEKEYRIVEAICERVLRSDGEMPSSAEVEAPLAVDAFVSSLEPLDRRDLSRLLSVIEHALPFWAGKRDRFTRLGGAERDHVLSETGRASSTTLRGALDAIKALCTIGYFAHPRAWEAIGYDGPLIGRRS